MSLSSEQVFEIRRSYRNAINRADQIGILSQLYLCSKEEICKVLGISVPVQKKGPTPRKYDKTMKERVVRAVLVDGMTNQEAADKFNVPIGTSSVWVRIAKRKLEESSHASGS